MPGPLHFAGLLLVVGGLVSPLRATHAALAATSSPVLGTVAPLVASSFLQAEPMGGRSYVFDAVLQGDRSPAYRSVRLGVIGMLAMVPSRPRATVVLVYDTPGNPTQRLRINGQGGARGQDDPSDHRAVANTRIVHVYDDALQHANQREDPRRGTFSVAYAVTIAAEGAGGDMVSLY